MLVIEREEQEGIKQNNNNKYYPQYYTHNMCGFVFKFYRMSHQKVASENVGYTKRSTRRNKTK